MHTLEDLKIAVIGLGYVGLPLAVAFGVKRPTIGFDIAESRVAELQAGHDATREVSAGDLAAADHLTLTADPAALAEANVYIITVPTPIDEDHRPDMSYVIRATEMVAGHMTEGDIVIYESTVYPGATEEDCVPVIERITGLTLNDGFFVGYSPERINPGDKERTLAKITKITSGSSPEAADLIDELYREIITAGTYKAPSIGVAEAAKVIENTQRDLNIAIVNELALIFDVLGVDTEEVLKAAGTKWNFLPFRPGLVGGHCIGVDPYYLAYKAEKAGYRSNLIYGGRTLNASMGPHIARKLVKKMVMEKVPVPDSRVLMMGYTFKENCPDTRNTKVDDVIAELRDYGVGVDIYDPWVEAGEKATLSRRLNFVDAPGQGEYEAIVVAVAHDEFRAMGPEAIRALGKDKAILFDVKYLFPANATDLRL